MAELTHFNEQRRARMVDVTEKPCTVREATAEGWIVMRAETLALIQNGALKKGDVWPSAGTACLPPTSHELIPMCTQYAAGG